MNSWVFNSTQTPLTKILMNSWVWNILKTPLTKIWLMNSWVRNLGFLSAKLFTSKSFIETKSLLIHHYCLKIFLKICYPLVELILRFADLIFSQPNTLWIEAKPYQRSFCTLYQLYSNRNCRIIEQYLKCQDLAPIRSAFEPLLIFTFAFFVA
jgi:hypothetical protein